MKIKTLVFFVISTLLISYPAYAASLTTTQYTDAEMDLFDLGTGSACNRTFDRALGDPTIPPPGQSDIAPQVAAIGCTATLQLPEPATLVFLGLGSVIFVRKK